MRSRKSKSRRTRRKYKSRRRSPRRKSTRKLRSKSRRRSSRSSFLTKKQIEDIKNGKIPKPTADQRWRASRLAGQAGNEARAVVHKHGHAIEGATGVTKEEQLRMIKKIQNKAQWDAMTKWYGYYV